MGLATVDVYASAMKYNDKSYYSYTAAYVSVIFQ